MTHLVAWMVAGLFCVPAFADWQLVWNDEFSGTGAPDSTKWSHHLGGDGWGNDELQHYTDRLENARQENGNLVIEARRERLASNNYTSAKLVTQGKASWTYGRMEIRARLPQGRGLWPAIWMLADQQNYGEIDWPDNGEIDIMEHVGHEPEFAYAALHTYTYNWWNRNNPASGLRLPNLGNQFHTYALEWDPLGISIFVDQTRYLHYPNSGSGWREWPYDQNFFLILNLAVGGHWGGMQGVDDSALPQKLLVDYVRVYQQF